MNKEKLFAHLKKQEQEKLIKLLNECYDCMCSEDIRTVFGLFEERFLNESNCDGGLVIKSVQKFIEDSLNGHYYAPFDINSKNYMHVPEETSLWFEKLSELLIESTQLTRQGDHEHATTCFSSLYELINKMESGDGIAFADELGMWMLPIREEPCINAYTKSASEITDPDLFVQAVFPLIQYKKETYKKIIHSANEQQQISLKAKMAQINK